MNYVVYLAVKGLQERS